MKIDARNMALNFLANSGIAICPVRPHVHIPENEYPAICISIMFETNTDPENRKMNPVFKGLNASSPKCSRLLLVS